VGSPSTEDHFHGYEAVVLEILSLVDDAHLATPQFAEDRIAGKGFLLLLERLSPDERAAFLLRTVFDYEYAEIGEVVGKAEATVRQLVSRARRRLGLDGERRFRASPARADGLAERFVAACRAGDVKAVEQMFTEDAEVHSDGGGRVSAARVVVRGRERAARFLAGVFSKKRRECECTRRRSMASRGRCSSGAGRSSRSCR
jgi:hypothetical protein